MERTCKFIPHRNDRIRCDRKILSSYTNQHFCNRHSNTLQAQIFSNYDKEEEEERRGITKEAQEKWKEEVEKMTKIRKMPTYGLSSRLRIFFSFFGQKIELFFGHEAASTYSSLRLFL